MSNIISIEATAPKAMFFANLLFQNGYRCTYSHTNVETGIFIINPAAKTFKWTANFTDVLYDMTIEDFTDLFL